MNKILTFTLIFLTLSCSDSKKEKKSEKLQIEKQETVISEPKPEQTEKSLFNIVFRKIEDIEYFKDFEKNSGTVINYEKRRDYQC